MCSSPWAGCFPAPCWRCSLGETEAQSGQLETSWGCHVWDWMAVKGLAQSSLLLVWMEFGLRWTAVGVGCEAGSCLHSPHCPQGSFNELFSPSSSSPDEDRLSKRKSIGETISLQVEVESRNSPEREQVAEPEWLPHPFCTLSFSLHLAPLAASTGAQNSDPPWLAAIRVK